MKVASLVQIVQVLAFTAQICGLVCFSTDGVCVRVDVTLPDYIKVVAPFLINKDPDQTPLAQA